MVEWAIQTLRPGSTDTENLNIALQYVGREAFARGHLCSAVWRAVDPELRPTTEVNAATEPAHWTDGSSVDPSTRGRFSPPDVRTEYIPMYSITAPDVDWNDAYGPSPEFAAVALSNLTEGDSMRRAVEPLVAGYRGWAGRCREQAMDITDQDLRAVALTNIEACETAAARIQSGIDRLAADPDALLAFNFANRAMAVQPPGRRASGQPMHRFSGDPFSWLSSC